MREFRDIISDIMAAVSEIELPINVVSEFEKALMDAPLRKPTVSVGFREIEIDADSIGNYAGKKGGAEQFSVPVRIMLTANIYLPKEMDGQIGYDILSMITDALLNSETVLYKVTTDAMRYDRNFLCVILPAMFHIHERALGDA